MASIDHIIVKVNDLDASVAFYTAVLGFANEGTDGPFTVLRIGPNCQLQLATRMRSTQLFHLIGEQSRQVGV